MAVRAPKDMVVSGDIFVFLSVGAGSSSSFSEDKDNFLAPFSSGEMTAAAMLDLLQGVAAATRGAVNASATSFCVEEESTATAVAAARPALERARIAGGEKKGLERRGEGGRPSFLTETCMERLQREEVGNGECVVVSPRYRSIFLLSSTRDFDRSRRRVSMSSHANSAREG